MNDEVSSVGSGPLRLPASKQEFWALIIAIIVVFVLVQIGAPIVRSLEFIDPKLRDYFIGMSFEAFPFVHRGSKQYLAKVSRSAEPELQDSAPWYVAGVLAAAVLFGWNQFVSFFSAMSLEVMQSAFPEPARLQLDEMELMNIQTMAALVIILPLCAVASVYAGMLLNRHTRSHTLGALGVAAAVFVTINVFFTWVMNPDYMTTIANVLSAGGAPAMQVAFGLSLVGIIVFSFGALGVFISRFNRERPLGKIVEAARKLPADQREALAVELAQRLQPIKGPASLIGSPKSPSGPVQHATAAEP